jgi:hypothetical protein
MKVYWRKKTCIIFLYNILFDMLFTPTNISEMLSKMCAETHRLGLWVICPLSWFDFNQNWNVSTELITFPPELNFV